MRTARQQREHASGIFAVAWFAESIPIDRYDRVGPEDEFAFAPNGPGLGLGQPPHMVERGLSFGVHSRPHPLALPRMGSQLYAGFLGVVVTRRQERALLI